MMSAYNRKEIQKLIDYIKSNDKIKGKKVIQDMVVDKFKLIDDTSVFYSSFFAIRFSSANSLSAFSNTVLGLSKLKKYDSIPFFVCLVTPTQNYLFLANSTLIKKISHSSHMLRVDNIRGSFNGSDIEKNFDDIENIPENFEILYNIHTNFEFEENLIRLVESTNSIVARDTRYKKNQSKDVIILNSAKRAKDFIKSESYSILNDDLYSRLKKVENEIAIASLIENVNIRGRIIEYLITNAESDGVREDIITSIQNGEPIPSFVTDNDLGDYDSNINTYITKTDIKTKVMYLSSSPKGYNIDKLLGFLAQKNTTYMIYFVGIGRDKELQSFLCSIFDDSLLEATKIQFHWAGRSSRGVSQFDGRVIDTILKKRKNNIDLMKSEKWLKELISL